MEDKEYKRDNVGRLVPIATIKPIDLARDQLVQEIAGKALQLRDDIARFKGEVFGDIAAFAELSAEQYGAKIGGHKGNVTLMSFDGRFKVMRAVSEYIVFDERLAAAKQLIDDCVREWSEGADPKIMALVNHAFQVDKAGNINTARVLSLRRMHIESDTWRSAMQAISDAVQVSGSKSYVRVYERVGDTDRYRPIPLDVAGA